MVEIIGIIIITLVQVEIIIGIIAEVVVVFEVEEMVIVVVDFEEIPIVVITVVLAIHLIKSRSKEKNIYLKHSSFFFFSHCICMRLCASFVFFVFFSLFGLTYPIHTHCCFMFYSKL